MKERETTPVIGEAPLQVVPSADFVYRLICDELFQNVGRRLPTDALELQEAAVEPRLEQVQQVGIDGLEMGMVYEHAEQILAHRDDGRGAVRSHVQQAE